MRVITMTDPVLFLKDQPDGTWMAVIVAFTERCPKADGVAEVVTFNVLSTRRQAENWAAEIIGPLREPSYVAPELRH